MKWFERITWWFFITVPFAVAMALLFTGCLTTLPEQEKAYQSATNILSQAREATGQVLVLTNNRALVTLAHVVYGVIGGLLAAWNAFNTARLRKLRNGLNQHEEDD